MRPINWLRIRNQSLAPVALLGALYFKIKSLGNRILKFKKALPSGPNTEITAILLEGWSNKLHLFTPLTGFLHAKYEMEIIFWLCNIAAGFSGPKVTHHLPQHVLDDESMRFPLGKTIARTWAGKSVLFILLHSPACAGAHDAVHAPTATKSVMQVVDRKLRCDIISGLTLAPDQLAAKSSQIGYYPSLQN